jgi:hypothetical protein
MIKRAQLRLCISQVRDHLDILILKKLNGLDQKNSAMKVKVLSSLMKEPQQMMLDKELLVTAGSLVHYLSLQQEMSYYEEELAVWI